MRLDGAKGFNARSAAERLDVGVHEASVTLMRLHRMGFLKRKSEVRVCVASSGAECRRGHQYVYDFSSKGRSYCKWLKKEKPLIDSMEAAVARSLYKSLPFRDRDTYEWAALNDALRSGYSPKKRPFEKTLLRLADRLGVELVDMKNEFAILEFQNADLIRNLEDAKSAIAWVHEFLRAYADDAFKKLRFIQEQVEKDRIFRQCLMALSPSLVALWGPLVPVPARDKGLNIVR